MTWKIFNKLLQYTATIAVAIWLLNTTFVKELVLSITPLPIIAELIAGALYTTVLTVPLSIALFASLAEVSNIYIIAAVGGVGAVIGDFVLMKTLKGLSHNLSIDAKKQPNWMRKFPKPILVVAGVLCLALPIPDEVAMALLGITAIRVRTFILVVYPAKAVGIFFVTLSAASLIG